MPSESYPCLCPGNQQTFKLNFRNERTENIYANVSSADYEKIHQMSATMSF